MRVFQLWWGSDVVGAMRLSMALHSWETYHRSNNPSKTNTTFFLGRKRRLRNISKVQETVPGFPEIWMQLAGSVSDSSDLGRGASAEYEQYDR